MKTWIGIAVVFIIAISTYWFVAERSKPVPVQITMHSNPFPLILGATTLSFTVTRGGDVIPDAALTVEANMMMEGMLPINMHTITYKDGRYEVPVEWPMAGQWMVDVSAKLPGDQNTVTESFEFYVYSTFVDNPGGPAEYRSVSQDQNVNTDPAHQYYIVIPQGTRVLMQLGQAPDVMPTELHMKINGMNTLVIQNNDIVDHTIGPYMVRAGETLRQTFTQPATYQGKCSVNVRATVKIIVDA